jgi:uncharacterized protein YfbU (UPF0304 family)
MKFTEEQRLIVMMLADIQKALNVQGELDLDLVLTAAVNRQEFAIAHKYDHIFGAANAPADFHFVVDVLEMWSVIEEAIESMDINEKGVLQAAAGEPASRASFTGFDGNREPTLRSHANLLVNTLGDFAQFTGRTLNSHKPMKDRYERMLVVFRPILTALNGERYMNPSEVGAVLSAT